LFLEGGVGKVKVFSRYGLKSSSSLITKSNGGREAGRKYSLAVDEIAY
jgi:hypothetical protein